MKFLFSKFKKYSDVFSPNSSYLHLDHNMTPFVLFFLKSDKAFFFFSKILIISFFIWTLETRYSAVMN